MSMKKFYNLWVRLLLRNSLDYSRFAIPQTSFGKSNRIILGHPKYLKINTVDVLKYDP